MADVEAVLTHAVPAIEAAVGAYGASVLTRAQQAAAEGTVSIGQKLLQRIWRRTDGNPRLEDAVADLAADGTDPDTLAALRRQLRKILTEDRQLLEELAGILSPTSPGALAHGTRSVAIGGNNSGPISTGDHSPIQPVHE
jgi:hypothetical protein